MSDENERLRADRDEWRQCCKVEARLRREFHDKAGRFEKALIEIEHHSTDKNAAATARAALEQST